jgi:beta-mannosidase
MDLFKAGVIENPYYEFNSLKCEWVENKCWLYKKTLAVSESDVNRRLLLVFEGVNYESRFYLNGKLIGTHKNMFTPVKIDISGIVTTGDNLLEVMCENVPVDETQMGYTSKCREQTARFFYSWDFCTRLVGVGLWQNVGLYVYDDCLFENFKVTSDYDGTTGRISIAGVINNCVAKASARITTRFSEAEIDCRAIDIKDGIFETDICVESPALWWPNGYGEQNLYNIEIELLTDNGLQDKKRFDIGIRSIAYTKNTGSPDDALPYTVVVNGIKIWLRGMNFLPIDHMCGAVEDDKYLYYAKLLKNQNVNLLRVWGGAYFEKPLFYELCDKYGFLVWQEFTQSNSAMDGIPSQIPEFLEEFKKSTVFGLETLRNYTCITIWDGGNELKDADRNPIGMDNPNIRMLSELVEKYDSQRIFHPSCPSGPNFNSRIDDESIRKKRNHNIHGQWAYMGKEYHYTYYNKCNHLLQGEFGVNGCSDEDSIKKFIAAENLEGYKSNSASWLFHGNGWWNSYPRECDIFGEQNVNTLEKFVGASQLVQAEGLRYIIESNIRRAFECSGNIIWQFSEPSPNINCSNLVDYYGLPKMAFYTVKNTYRTIAASLKYSKIHYSKGEKLDFEIYLSNFGQDASVTTIVQIYSISGEILFSEAVTKSVRSNIPSKIFMVDTMVDDDFGEMFFVRLTVEGDRNDIYSNDYAFGTGSVSPYAPLYNTESPSLDISRTSKGGQTEFIIRNIGETTAFYVSLKTEDNTQAFFSDNFKTIFPGEEFFVTMDSEKPDTKVTIKDISRRFISIQ